MRMFFVAGIGIAVFIELLLISKRKKSDPDRILALWMFLIVVYLFFFYLFYTGEVFNYPFLLGVERPFPLLHGVFLYLYVGSLARQLPGNRKLLFLHFLPVTAMYVYLIAFFLLPAEQKIQVYRNHGAGYEWFNTLRSAAITMSGVFYVMWSVLLLKRHQKNIRAQFSDLEEVNLLWLQVLTYGLGAIWFLVIFFQSDVLINTGVVVFIFLIGFFGVRQGEIFTATRLMEGSNGERKKMGDVASPAIGAPPDQPLAIGNESRKKYPKSGLTEETAGKLHQQLKRKMVEEALYKKSDLSITDLSSALGVHPNYLSQVINQEEKKNFYDFVNAYRIEEFKRLVANPRNRQYTLLSLAYDCGFSSKASFNRCFKKCTGKTPSQYLDAVTSDQIALS
jgi:AraC-like DNA-binding protein